jgi:hypothetical protein
MGRQRFATGLVDQIFKGVGRFAARSASSSCSSSSSSSSCSMSRTIFSDDRPNCIRFSLAVGNSNCAIFQLLRVYWLCKLPHQHRTPVALRSPEILNIDARASLVRHSRFRPLAVHCHAT